MKYIIIYLFTKVPFSFTKWSISPLCPACITNTYSSFEIYTSNSTYLHPCY